GGISRGSGSLAGSGFIAIDGIAGKDDAHISRFVEIFYQTHLHRSDLHPDVWPAIVVHDLDDIRTKLTEVAGEKYSYAELEDFSDLIGRTVLGAPEASKVERRGLLPQAVYLQYSQYRLAEYGLQPADLSKVLGARNIITTGGDFQTGERDIIINPSGQFESRNVIGDVVVAKTSAGAPVY